MIFLKLGDRHPSKLFG